MDWLRHPAYVLALDELVKKFKAKVYSFKHLRPFIFLCGARGSERRDFIASYLEQHYPDVFVFYAEDVWEHIPGHENQNALQLEEQLALLADMLVILVESPGTMAELGAFSSSDPLRAKLLPLIDERFCEDPSFINTGPIRWVDSDSRFAPSIFCDFTVILQSMGELEDRIKRIPRRGRLKSDRGEQLANNPKHLLLLLADIVAVIGPAPAEHFAEFLNRLLGVPPAWNVTSLLGLATSTKLIQAIRQEKGQLLYHRELTDGELESFQRRRRMINLAHERARFLCVLQKISASTETQLSIAG